MIQSLYLIDASLRAALVFRLAAMTPMVPSQNFWLHTFDEASLLSAGMLVVDKTDGSMLESKIETSAGADEMEDCSGYEADADLASLLAAVISSKNMEK